MATLLDVTEEIGGRVFGRRRPLSLSRRAVHRRVQHLLNPRLVVLRKCSRRSRDWHELGEYYIVSMLHGGVLARHQRLEDVAFQLGVIGNEDFIADE